MNNPSNPPESDKEVQLKLEDVKKLEERRKALEREKDKMNNYNNYEVCNCDETGKCCCCKRQYPLSFLNPRKQYSALARCAKKKKKLQNRQNQ